MMRLYCLLLMVSLCFFACQAPNSSDGGSRSSADLSEWTVPVKQLSKEEYPDNPDWNTRHSAYDQMSYPELLIEREEDATFSFIGIPGNNKTDTLHLKNLNIEEWIPTASKQLLKDPYLTHIGVFNQEWNRHQVRFEEGQFQLKSQDQEFKITRVDLARNCLNAYLWELIIYAQDKDSLIKPYYHGWFNFPKDLYAELFNKRNPDLDYEDFRKVLEDWVEPESKMVHLHTLRTVNQEQEINVENYNDQYYELKAERKRKYPNIVRPKKVAAIQDYLNDSTRFSTFSAPGYYDTKNPAKTKLGRLATLEKVVLRETTANNTSKMNCLELEYQFRHNDGKTLTRLVVGGIQPENIPSLSVAEAHKGWQMPMGIGNHSFYESYDFQQAHPAKDNPYFAVLLDEEGNWLDSHGTGIDGPLFHWDQDRPGYLHLWILSFERHAFVGHFASAIKLENKL